MATRILGSTGSRRRRRFLLVPLLIAVVVGLSLTVGAQAIHNPGDTSLELDGNVRDNPAGPPDDWANIFTPPNGASFSTGIINDPLGATIFTGAQPGGSSKDDTDISGWRWKCGSVPDKDEISNASAVLYSVSSEKRLYFMADRFSNGGTSHIGVWFLKNTVDTDPSNPGANCGPTARTFTDVHVPRTAGPDTIFGNADDDRGDILVLSDFTQGGTIPNLKIFEWYGTGGDQKGGTLNLVGQSTDCIGLSHPPAAEACATVNPGTLSGADGPPWTYSPKQGAAQSYPPGSFFEGGVDLGAFGLGGECFGAVLAETRSSAEIDAVLKDFVISPFEKCESSTVTTPKDGSGGNIPAGGLSIGTGSVTAKDRAVVTGAGGTGGAPVPTGKVKFYICGPAATDAAAQCPAAGQPDSNGITQIGAAAGEDLVATGGTSEAAVTSAAATLTKAAHYCWRADYLGDANYPADPVTGVASSDNSLTECFTVNPVKPTLDTQAGSSPVDFGQPVTDRATLTGTANKPGSGGGGTDGSINPTTAGLGAGGSIIFKLFGPDSCTTLATDFPAAGISVGVSGDGTYPPVADPAVSFTPKAPGTYHWKATYAGDSPNTLAADDHNTLCTDEDEDVVVRQIPTEIKTKQSWFPNDTATVTATSGNLGANGSVVFTLHDNATCSGPALYTETKSITGGTPSQEVGTNNTSVAITTAYGDAADSVKGAFSWKVVYTPAAADTAHTGKQSACTAGSTEKFSITYTNDPGPGSNLP